MRHGRPRQGGGSVAISTDIPASRTREQGRRGAASGDEITRPVAINLCVERTKPPQCVARSRGCAARRDRRHGSRPSLRRQAASPTIRSVFPMRDRTARRICARRYATGKQHERNFPLQHLAARNRTGGQAIVAPRIAGKDSIAANLPPHSDGKASAAQKAADKTASCRNERRPW